jgi:hypothetical protein
MDLPNVSPEKLQQMAMRMEMGRSFQTLEELSFALAASSWAQQEELEADVIEQLLVHHKTITKVKAAGVTPPPVVQLPKPVPANPPTPQPAPPPPKPVPQPVKVEVSEAKAAPTTNETKPEVTTYTEAGRGRKQCPTCKKFMGARNKICVCGHQFQQADNMSGVTPVAQSPKPASQALEQTVETPKVEVATYTEGGRGRRQCPSCKKYVSIRTATCACGHQLQSSAHKPAESSTKGNQGSTEPAPTKTASSTERAATVAGCAHIIWTPSGKVPVPLKGLSEPEVREWVEEVRYEIAREQNAFLSMEGLIYWGRYGCNLSLEDMPKFKELLREVCPAEPVS